MVAMFLAILICLVWSSHPEESIGVCKAVQSNQQNQYQRIQYEKQEMKEIEWEKNRNYRIQHQIKWLSSDVRGVGVKKYLKFNQ